MFMPHIRNPLFRNWLLITFTVVTSYLLVTIFALVSGIEVTSDTVERIDAFGRGEIRKNIELELRSRFDEIEFDLRSLQNKENQVTKNKIDAVVSQLLDSNLMEISDHSVRRDEAVQLFNQIVKHDSDYIYFSFSTKGELLRTGTGSEFLGRNLIDSKDKNGVEYVKELVAAKESENGVYVTYHWPKVKGGEPLKKTSFSYYIPELDIVIGVGSYEEDIENRLKLETFERLTSYNDIHENKIFVVTFDGQPLVYPDIELTRDALSQIKSLSNEPIHKVFMKALSSDGYREYETKYNQSDVIAQRIAYVIPLERWGAYIGVTSDISGLRSEVDSYIEEYQKRKYREVINIFMILAASSAVLFILIRRALNIQSKFLRQEELVFEQLIQMSVEGVLIINRTGQVIYSNEEATRIFGNQTDEYIDQFGNLFLEKVDDTHYKVEVVSGRTLYVTVHNEKILYKDQDSEIYFIKDNTAQFSMTSQMEKLALYDPLTSLPNRRKLEIDFEELAIKGNDVITVGLIDIDDFKKVNDTYGHDVGDKVLQLLGTVFSSRIRKDDQIYRYGGEEFVVIMKDIHSDDSVAILNEINRTLHEENKSKFDFGVSFSGGAVTVQFDNRSKNFEEILKDADMLLYQAKAKGKNRVEIKLDS